MLYQDTVESEVLVHKPWFIAAFFAVVLAIFLLFDLTATIMGEIMRPVIGEPLQSGFYGQFAIAFVIAVGFWFNLVLIDLHRGKCKSELCGSNCSFYSLLLLKYST